MMSIKKFYIFAILLISACIQIYPKKNIEIMKNVAFTHEDSLIPVKELKVVKKVDLNFSNDFVAVIDDMAVAPNGNIFVYDPKQIKLFLLDLNHQLTTTFAKSGQGPGELMQMGYFKSVYLNAGWDNKLYLYNHGNNMVHVYSQSGNYLSTIRPVGIEYTIGKPTAYRDGSVAMIGKKGRLACYTPQNGKYKQKIIELDHSLCSKFLFMAPSEQIVDGIMRDTSYLSYGYLADGHLALWFNNCGELLLFDRQLKLVATHSIRPKMVLLNFKNKLLANMKRSGDRYEGLVPFGKIIGSVGNPEEFLIISFAFVKEKTATDHYEIEFYSYLFDERLKLKKIYKMPSEALSLFIYKSKNYFYSTDIARTSLLLLQ